MIIGYIVAIDIEPLSILFQYIIVLYKNPYQQVLVAKYIIPYQMGVIDKRTLISTNKVLKKIVDEHFTPFLISDAV
jgi:hypothetical protein